VLEALHGYLMVAERLAESAAEYRGAWNFGPESDQVKTVVELAETMIRILGSGTLAICPDPQLHEARTLLISSEKARRRLRWKTVLSVDEALKWTAEWYRGFYAGNVPMRMLSEDQIKRYMAIYS
jgi:CDP-glucose 4,6-dehydratase